MTDQELVRACLEGSGKAQRLLYDKYSGQMMAVCLRYAGNEPDAQDMMQEGFIKVFDKLGQYSGKGSLVGWIRSVVISCALVHIRKEKRFMFHEDVEEVQHLTDDDVDAVSRMSQAEIMELIRQMPDGYRTVFNLFAIEGYSHKEIAELIEVSESTSKTQFFKAKAWLKKELNALERTT
ncbi:MAG: sigma-70 family RNA polymerase sigma factor [Flavobacteriales bacterium]|nr:sigma-70 family RNA polymerase sigma factor [Flavobacteriales bacterium]